ncbi:MAG: hypothetical protein K8W52_31070 [Deltaproteobacteria bacterium]|nr:hypothetical protein [Deltaproteobacteria bacterium]
MAVTPNAYAGSRFAVTIGSYSAGYIKSFTQGNFKGSLNETSTSTEHWMKKNIAAWEFSDFSLEASFAMGKGLQDWMQSAMDSNAVPMDGSVVVADFNGKAIREVQFFRAYITKISLPALSAADKANIFLTFSFKPTELKYMKASGDVAKAAVGPTTKSITGNNFSLKLGSFNCKRVNKIEAFEWSCTVKPDPHGEAQYPELACTTMKQPDLTFTINALDGQQFEDWAKAWFMDGKREEKDELTGSLDLLGPNMKDIMATLTFQNVGLQELTPPKQVRDDSLQFYTVKTYTEHTKLEMKKTDA